MKLIELSQASNNTINILRVICAYLVVAIHTHPFEDINIKIGFIATQVIPRIAVPFFLQFQDIFIIDILKNTVMHLEIIQRDYL